MTPGPSQTALAELRESINQAFSEMKDMLTDIGQRVRTLEMQEAGCSPLINARMGEAEKKISAHETRLKDIETAITTKAVKKEVDEELKFIRDTLAELKNTNKILSWIGGLVGSALVLYLLASILKAAFGS
jgi:chromosome segregation ATPase